MSSTLAAPIPQSHTPVTGTGGFDPPPAPDAAQWASCVMEGVGIYLPRRRD